MRPLKEMLADWRRTHYGNDELMAICDSADTAEALAERCAMLERHLGRALYGLGGCIAEPACGDCVYCNASRALTKAAPEGKP